VQLALLRRRDHRDASAAPDLEQPFVSKLPERTEDRVPVHLQHGSQVERGRQPLPRDGLAFRDRLRIHAEDRDRVEDTVDYADVCEQVALAAQERSYRTLERLCSAIADRLVQRYGAESVRVKAAKPEPPIPLPVEEVSVEVWKE